MLQEWVIVSAAFSYLGLLFAIAYYADKRADAGRSIVANPYIYSLSLAVYATAWTFYGSVGRAATDGVGFLPIYLGPTLMIALWWIVMRKILRISKQNRITSLADFIASRYGKSALLGGVVTIIAVIGIIPYISLQLKGISNSYIILTQYPEIVMPQKLGAVPLAQDTGLWVAMILAAFTIAFGTRHLDSAEHHEGMVAAIAFESLVKLLAFLAVGVFVTFGVYNGFGDLFGRAAGDPKLSALIAPLEGVAGGYASWVWLTILSMFAIMFLPRQFQVTVIENTNEKHLNKAIWLFPLYMLAINIFVLPIAFGGGLHFPTGTRRCRHVRADRADGRKARRTRAARVHRRPVGGDRHGDRRNDRAVDDGVQRPRDADAVAPARAAPRRTRGSDVVAAWHPARRDRADPAARISLFQNRR